MAWPNDLQIALKEWATVCTALSHGRQIILLRKGGIHESAGEFEIEHRHFLLFPTYVHQKEEMLKTEERANLDPRTTEPAKIEISLACTITDIIPMTSQKKMESLNEQHIWTNSLIDMRFNYRPENPLYLLLVRTHRLTKPTTIENTPAYAGCKSWVPLEHPIDTTNATPVLNDAQYTQHRDNILKHITATQTRQTNSDRVT